MSNDCKLTIFEPSKEPRTVILHVNEELIDGRRPIFDEHGNPSIDYCLILDETEEPQISADTEKIKAYINNWQAQGDASVTPRQARKSAQRKRIREIKKLTKIKKKISKIDKKLFKKKDQNMSLINCVFDRNPLIDAKDMEEEREILRAMKATRFDIKKILNIKPSKTISLNTNFNPTVNTRIELNSRRPPDIVVLTDSDSDSDNYSDVDNDHIRLNTSDSTRNYPVAQNFANDTSYSSNAFVTSATLSKTNRKKKVEVVEIYDSSDSDVECVPIEDVVESISDDDDVDKPANDGKNIGGDDEDVEMKAVDDQVTSELAVLVDSFVSKYIKTVCPPLGELPLEPIFQPPPLSEIQKKPESKPQPEVESQPETVSVPKPKSKRKRNKKKVTFSECVVECEDKNTLENDDNEPAKNYAPMEVEPAPSTPENQCPSDSDDCIKIDDDSPSKENTFSYNFESLPSPDYNPVVEIINDDLDPLAETNVEELYEYMNNQALNKKPAPSVERYQQNDPRNPRFQRLNGPINKQPSFQRGMGNRRFMYGPQNAGEAKKKFDKTNQSEDSAHSPRTEIVLNISTDEFQSQKFPQKRPYQSDIPEEETQTYGRSGVPKHLRFQPDQECDTPMEASQSANTSPEKSFVQSRQQFQPKRAFQNYSNHSQTPPNRNCVMHETDIYQNQRFSGQRRYQNETPFCKQDYQGNPADRYYEDTNCKTADYEYDEYEGQTPNHLYNPPKRFSGGEYLPYEEEKFHPNMVWQRGKFNKRFQRPNQQYNSNQNHQAEAWTQGYQKTNTRGGYPSRKPFAGNRNYNTYQEEHPYTPHQFPKTQQFRGNRGRPYHYQYNQQTPRFQNQNRFQNTNNFQRPRFIMNLTPQGCFDDRPPAHRFTTPIAQRPVTPQTYQTPRNVQPVQQNELFTRRGDDKFKYKANIDDFHESVPQRRSNFDENFNEPKMKLYEMDVLKKLQSEEATSGKDNNDYFTWESNRSHDYVEIPVDTPIADHIPPWSKENAADSHADEINAISRRSYISNNMQR